MTGDHQDRTLPPGPQGAPGAARGGADVLALAFGTTVAMWVCGYLLLLPAIRRPFASGIVLLILLIAGGRTAGEVSGRGWRGGLWVGLVAAVLNLLVLGSFLGGRAPNSLVPSAALWLPGWLLLGAGLGALGGMQGAWVGRARTRDARSPCAWDWTSAFCWVAAAATFFLLIIGGIVTGSASGLAVTDWPNSFGYNMFLFPLTRMTGGVYYEHAHRLFGSLVGLTALVLAVHLQRFDPRPRVRALGWAALGLVVVQGILGGLRVTGRFTMSASPGQTSPSTALAIVHGVVGQLVFAALVALAVVTTARWRSDAPPLARPSAATDRSLARLFVGVLIIQLVLGSILRHVGAGLFAHIAFAIIVAVCGLALGVRSWGLYPEARPLTRTGRAIIYLIAIQVGLGIFAAVIVDGRLGQPNPPTRDAIVTTLHQANGAILLATAVALLLWLERLVVPAPAPAAAAVPAQRTR